MNHKLQACTHQPWTSGKHWFVSTLPVTKQYYFILLGCIAMSIFISMAVQIIPLLGALVSFAITGPINVGVFYVAHRSILQEKSQMQDMFVCFQDRKDAWLQIVYCSLLMALFVLIFAIVIWGVVALSFGAFSFDSLFSQGLSTTAKTKLIGLGLILFAGSLGFFAVIAPMYYFAYPLIFFKRMSAWSSLKLSFQACWANVGSLSVFGLLALALVFAGFLCLIVGALLVLPWFYTAYMKSYHEIFGIPEVMPGKPLEPLPAS